MLSPEKTRAAPEAPVGIARRKRPEASPIRLAACRDAPGAVGERAGGGLDAMIAERLPVRSQNEASGTHLSLLDSVGRVPYKPRRLGGGPDHNGLPFNGAQVAQLVEQRTENPRVAGSIPALGTIPPWQDISG